LHVGSSDAREVKFRLNAESQGIAKDSLRGGFPGRKGRRNLPVLPGGDLGMLTRTLFAHQATKRLKQYANTTTAEGSLPLTQVLAVPCREGNQGT